MPNDLNWLPAHEMVRRFATGDLSPVDVLDATLARLREVDPILNAVCLLDEPQGRRLATESADRWRRGAPVGPLDGVPVAIKDLQDTAGVRTTYGSVLYADQVPQEDAPAVARLRAAGMIVVGKTNTSAFGTLGETKNRLGGPTSNPHDLSRTAGGSSGGSAAALAAGVVPLGTGTDCAGSITSPAAFCGIFGLKGSRGRIPNPPVDDSLLTNDSGALGRTVLDAALAVDAMAGWHGVDPLSVRAEPPRLADVVREAQRGVEAPLAGLRVLVAPDAFGFPVEAEPREAALRTARRVEALGATVDEGPLEIHDPYGIYMPLYGTDIRRTLGDALAARPDDLYEETKADLAEGPPMTAEEYVGVLNRLWHLRAQTAALFTRYDVVLTPATATAAFPHDEPPAVIGGRDVRPGWVSFMPYSIVWNMTGQPTASVPSGTDRDGLPLGTMVVAPALGEAQIVRVAAALEIAP
jgi:Asp-tRNA(Asn)/Glu-tRNA(Gln) amidotransferase A subunit family amidase